MPIIPQLTRIIKKPLKYMNTNKNDRYLIDINDGKIYKNLVSFENSLLKREEFSFMINTDGVQICTKSDLSLWPVFLSINEINIKERFFIENIIMAGSYLFF